MADKVPRFRYYLRDRHLSHSTQRAYVGDIEQFLAWLAEAAISPSCVTPKVISMFVEDLRKAGTVWEGKTGPISDSSTRRKLVAIACFYRFLKISEDTTPNPITPQIRRALGRSKELRTELLGKEDLASLLSQPRLSTPGGIRDSAILLLMFLGALTVNEIHELDVRDLNSAHSQLNVGKDGNRRCVELSDSLRTAVTRWCSAREVLVEQGPGPLFVRLRGSSNSPVGGRISRRGLRKVVDKYLQLAGLKEAGASCRSLRLTGIVMATKNGLDAEAIAKQAGVSFRAACAYERVAAAVFGKAA